MRDEGVKVRMMGRMVVRAREGLQSGTTTMTTTTTTTATTTTTTTIHHNHHTTTNTNTTNHLHQRATSHRVELQDM